MLFALQISWRQRGLLVSVLLSHLIIVLEEPGVSSRHAFPPQARHGSQGGLQRGGEQINIQEESDHFARPQDACQHVRRKPAESGDKRRGRDAAQRAGGEGPPRPAQTQILQSKEN